MAYDNTNRGTLGKNKNPKSDKSPPYAGKLNVDGVEYWLSGWVQTNKKDGSQFFSLTVKPVDAERVPGSRHTPIDIDDAVPF